MEPTRCERLGGDTAHCPTCHAIFEACDEPEDESYHICCSVEVAILETGR